MPDQYTKAMSREIIRRCVEEIAEFWPKGAPVDEAVHVRFDQALLESLRRGDLRTIEMDCQKYKTWMAKKAARYVLG